MLLKKCTQCRKDIPSTITVCPYCQWDEVAKSPAAFDKTPTALDTQTRTDLNMLGSDDPLVRKSAADRLSQKGADIVPALINIVNEHSQKGMAEAAKLLGRLRDQRAVTALVQALKIGDEDLHAAAVWALSQMNDAQALEELVRESTRNNPTVQGYLAHVMGGYRDSRVIHALIKLLYHPNHEVSFQAAWALGEAGDKSAIRPLRQILGRKDRLLRSGAEAALRRLGGPVRRLYPIWGWVLGGVGVCGVSGLLWYFYK